LTLFSIKKYNLIFINPPASKKKKKTFPPLGLIQSNSSCPVPTDLLCRALPPSNLPCFAAPSSGAPKVGFLRKGGHIFRTRHKGILDGRWFEGNRKQGRYGKRYFFFNFQRNLKTVLVEKPVYREKDCLAITKQPFFWI